MAASFRWVLCRARRKTPRPSILRNLLQRGFTFKQGLLVVIDGAKGLTSAVEQVFGSYALIQRCQWHKRENGDKESPLVSYLKQSDQALYRRRLQRAYDKPTYAEAKKALLKIKAELSRVNRSAANSLAEGLEQTLTLHRLGLFEALGKSLKTTNCIENLNGQLGKYLGRVKRWMDSDQRCRWVACGLLEIEQRMRRIDRFDQLPKLRQALLSEIGCQNQEEQEPLAQINLN